MKCLTFLLCCLTLSSLASFPALAQTTLPSDAKGLTAPQPARKTQPAAKAQPGLPPDAKGLETLDSAFDRAMKEDHTPGLAVAVVLKGRLIYARGFGYRDLEAGLPVTPNTLFAIGSCTKAFTASLIGMLQAEGRLDLDTPVRNYLPELKFYNDNMNARITLRDMMCHRTGLPRHDASWYYFYTPSREELLQRIQYQAPTADLREKWQYNNLMFVAQGAVIEKLTGHTWEENIRKRIFEPLDMQRSTTDYTEWIHDKDVAAGYGLRHDSSIRREPYRDLSVLNPAGGINSCVEDMARWVIAWMGAGWYEGKKVLPTAWLTEAISSQMVIGAALPTKDKPDLYLSNYGLGWMVGSYRGHYRVSHDGQITGFTANTCFFPTDSLGIIVLCNQESSNITAAVRNLVSDKMLGLPYYDWQTDLKTLTDKTAATVRLGRAFYLLHRVPHTSPSHPLWDYEGTYRNKGYGAIQVVLQHDSLFARAPAAAFWLKHFHYDIFESFEQRPGEPIDTTAFGIPHFQFNTDDGGKIRSVSVQVEPALPPAVFVRP